MEWRNTWSTLITTMQKFLQIHMKIKCHKQMSRLLQPDQRQNKTIKEGTCWYAKNHTDVRKKMDWHWAIRTDSRCIPRIAESDQSFSTQSNSTTGRPHEEDQKGDVSIDLTIWEQSFTSVLFRETLDIISLILRQKDNILTQCGIFHHIYYIGCAFNHHSSINKGLIPGGQDSSKRQTVFSSIDPRDKSHEDPEHIDFSVPRRARYVHSAWKKHQNAVYWGWCWPCDYKRINILSNTTECKYPSRNTSSLLLSKSWKDWKLEKFCMKNHVSSPRPPTKISLRHDHDCTRGNDDEFSSTVEQQPVGKLAQQFSGEVPRVKLSKPTQPKHKRICDRSGKPEDSERVFVDEGKTSHSQEIDDNLLHKEFGSSDGTGNMWNCLKTFALSMLTMEQGNLWNQAQAHT